MAHYVCNGWFFSNYLYGNNGLNSSRTFHVLFHCQTSSVYCITEPWIVLQTNNASKSLNFISKMRTLLRKFIARFFHLMVSLCDLLKQLVGLMWLNFALNLHCWALYHQYTYVDCDLKNISELFWAVLMMTVNYWFVAARNVKNFAEGFRCEAFQNTAGASIETERPTTIQSFWWMGSWNVCRRSTSLLKICVQLRSSFLIQWIRNWAELLILEWRSEAIQKLPIYSKKTQVGGIIGPHFFKDAENRNVAVNGKRYRKMIFNFFLPKM